MDNSTQPLFRQIASLVEDAIVDGTLGEGDRAPSTNELADFHNINPATARKGISLLVDIGVLDKRRGIGMFVAEGARRALVADGLAVELRGPRGERAGPGDEVLCWHRQRIAVGVARGGLLLDEGAPEGG